MSAIADLTEEEKYFVAILQDQSGIDPAELLWTDDTSPDFVFRCWDFQYAWYRDTSKFQIDQAGRALGKSVGMTMRAWAFPFTNPGEEMLLTAPELIHLDPVTQAVERRISEVRLSREFLKTGSGVTGFTHRPFRAQFRNGARIVGRIPQKDGKGVKGSCSAGTLITTPVGHLPVEKIQCGDLVLTGEGRFMPVLEVHSYEADTVVVAGAGHRGIRVSENHRFRARRNRNPQRTRNLGTATWLPVYDEEHRRYYWGSPASVPVMDLPDFPRRFQDPQALLWIAGRYVADGNQQRVAVRITADEARIGEVALQAALAGYSPKRVRHDNAAAICIYDSELSRWLLLNFGQHADGKFLPLWLHSAPQYLIDAFLDGYLNGDGYWNATKGRWEITTVSKELAVGLRLLGNQLGYTTGLTWVDPRPNRLCANPLRAYRVNWSDRARAIVEEGVSWQKIRSITPAGPAMVYDLVVDEDRSYVGDALIHKGGYGSQGEPCTP